MTLNDLMAVILRYFTAFGKRTFQHNTNNRRVDLWRIYARVYCIL